MRLEEAEGLLRSRYADEKNGDLAKELGVGLRTLSRWAARLGLRKSEAFLGRVRWEAQMELAHRRLCGERVGGVKKGEGKATAGSFGNRRLTPEQEEKRKEAIRKTAWEERKRILHGEERKTRWRMCDYGKKKVGGKWQKA